MIEMNTIILFSYFQFVFMSYIKETDTNKQTQKYDIFRFKRKYFRDHKCHHKTVDDNENERCQMSKQIFYFLFSKKIKNIHHSWLIFRVILGNQIVELLLLLFSVVTFGKFCFVMHVFHSIILDMLLSTVMKMLLILN